MCSRIVCMVTVTMVGFLLLASCSGTPASPVASGTSPLSTKPYGSITIATGFRPGSLDPHVGDRDPYQVMGSFVIDSLVRQAPGGKLIPDLAERWEISSDGMSHTFHIRKGVKFHDGSDLTGADVKFSLERMIAPGSTAGSAKAWDAAVARVDLEDGYTVILRLKAPQFELLEAAEVGATAVLPKKYIEEKGVDYFQKNVIGSGPFKVVRYEPGTSLELEAVENHWRAVPQFKNVTLLNVPEEGTRVAMLRTGELDIASISIDSIATLEAGGLRTMSWNTGGSAAGFFYFDVENPDKYPVGDQRVRKALVLAMNRKEIVDKLYGGKGSPSVMHPVGPSEEFFDPNILKLDPYDPDEAKRLLAQAGYPNGFDMRIWDVVGGLPLLNQAIAGYWLRIGVRAQLEAIDYGAFRQLAAPKHNPRIWNSVWFWPSFVKRGFTQIVSNWHSQRASAKNIKDPKVDELIDKVSSATSSDERRRRMTEAAAAAKDAYTTIGIVYLYDTLALGPKVGAATPYWNRFAVSTIETLPHAK